VLRKKPPGQLLPSAHMIEREYRQYEAAKTHAIPAMDELIGWLPAHMPADETTTIAHGDFRLCRGHGRQRRARDFDGQGRIFA
jgi:aminoglycoside phosphotransferase (APT) family kinase protein